MMRYMPKRFDLFDDVFNSFFDEPVQTSAAVMKTDVREKDGYYTLDVELPGYAKEDVKMEISEGYLTINAAHNFTNEEKDERGNLIRSERSFGSCSRSFFVGENIKAEDVKASFKDGMLMVTLPSAKQKHIESKETILID